MRPSRLSASGNIGELIDRLGEATDRSQRGGGATHHIRLTRLMASTPWELRRSPGWVISTPRELCPSPGWVVSTPRDLPCPRPGPGVTTGVHSMPNLIPACSVTTTTLYRRTRAMPVHIRCPSLRPSPYIEGNARLTISWHDKVTIVLESRLQ